MLWRDFAACAGPLVEMQIRFITNKLNETESADYYKDPSSV